MRKLILTASVTALVTISFFTRIALAQKGDKAQSAAPRSTDTSPEKNAVESGAVDQSKDDTEVDVNRKRIIVTATRTERSAFDEPFTVNQLQRDELQERQIRTTPELFREVPGVMVQKTAHGQGSPFIRGFTGFRNLFLIDGVRLNNSVFRTGPNQYWNTVYSGSLDGDT